MELSMQSPIRFSDLMARPGVVLVQPEIELHRNQPQPGHRILAGVCLPDGDGPGLARIMTIEYHQGRNAWHRKVEHSRQQADEWQADTLPTLIQRFEREVGTTLPAIKLVHLGVGVYPAQSLYASENPWALENGRFYSVQDPQRGRRTFVADVRDGRTLISFIGQDGQSASEAYAPTLVLTAADWKSLSRLPDELPTSKAPASALA